MSVLLFVRDAVLLGRPAGGLFSLLDLARARLRRRRRQPRARDPYALVRADERRRAQLARACRTKNAATYADRARR